MIEIIILILMTLILISMVVNFTDTYRIFHKSDAKLIKIQDTIIGSQLEQIERLEEEALLLNGIMVAERGFNEYHNKVIPNTKYNPGTGYYENAK